MRWHLLHTGVPALAGVLLGVLLLQGAFLLLQDRRVPVEVSAAWIEPDKARPGDTVTLFVTRLKNRDCPLERHTFWVDRSGVVVSGPIRSGGKVGPGEDPRTIKVRIMVPENLTPGREWAFDPTLYYHCPDKTYAIKQPPAWVRII